MNIIATFFSILGTLVASIGLLATIYSAVNLGLTDISAMKVVFWLLLFVINFGIAAILLAFQKSRI
jgi:hypothetical protein